MCWVLNVILYLIVPLGTAGPSFSTKASSLIQSHPRCSVNYLNSTKDIRRDGCNRDQYYYEYFNKYGKEPRCLWDSNGYQYHLYEIEAIAGSTITCTNVHRPQDITYQYTEEEYEQFLNITHSNISTLPSLALIPFTTITKLYLSQIYIKTIQPGAFNGLSRLRELYLDNNELSEVSNAVFNSLHRLEVLNLTNNKIVRIDKQAFMGMANLEMLYLKNNQLSKIEKGVFENQQHLKYLDLSDNPLEDLSLDGSTNLETLLLSGSALSDFQDDLSNSTMKLLDLSSGNFSLIDFSYFPIVTKLDLSRNRITAINNCEILDAIVVNLDSNEISTINGFFKGISEIYLGHNKLKTLNSTLLRKSENLISADFSSNEIFSVDKNVFQGLVSLKKLFLQNNEIVKIDPVLFRSLTSLTFLNLSHNGIEEFQYGTFDSLTMLEVLDISDNKLVDLHQYTFTSLSNLMDLRFDNNRISSFDVRDLRNQLQNLRFVSLNGNPWKCEELVKISKVFKNFEISVLGGDDYGVENFHGIRCTNQKEAQKPFNVSGFSAEKFSENFQKAIEDGVKNSKMNYFFNDDFKDSKFFQYFDKDYVRSNFFKFLNDFKLVTVQQNVNDSKAEKFTSVQIAQHEISNVSPVQILGVILNFAILLSLIFMIYLLTNLLKKKNFKLKPDLSSQMELC